MIKKEDVIAASTRERNMIEQPQREALIAAERWDQAWQELMRSTPKFVCPTCNEYMTYNSQQRKFFHSKRGSTCRQRYAHLIPKEK